MPSSCYPQFHRNDLPPDIGLIVRDRREAAGMSRVELAQAAGVMPRTLARIERGAQRPRCETLRAIADVFNVPLYFLASEWLDDEEKYRHFLYDHPGRLLRKIRKAARVTLADAAAAAGVHPSTLSRYERMQTDSLLITPSLDQLNSNELAKLLGFESREALSEACIDYYA